MAKTVGAFANDCGLVPFHLEALASLHRGPRGIGHNGYARAGVIPATGTGFLSELMSHMNRGNFEDAADAGKCFQFFGVKAARSASVGRTALHASDEHSGDVRIDAELGGAVDLGGGVGAARGLAEEREVRRIF